jgi:transposase-like protein
MIKAILLAVFLVSVAVVAVVSLMAPKKTDTCPVCGSQRKYRKVISTDDQIYRHKAENRYVCDNCDAGKYTDTPSISLD